MAQTAVEFNDGRSFGVNDGGTVTGTRVFKVTNTAPNIAAINAVMNLSPTPDGSGNFGVGEGLIVGTSTYPGQAFVYLDDVQITKTGNLCTVTARYSNTQRFIIRDQPDPLDDQFFSGQYTEEPAEVVVPTIVQTVKTWVTTGLFAAPVVPVVGWELGEPLIIPVYRTVYTLRTSTGLANDIYGFNAAQAIHKQTNRLHKLGDGNYWRYRPRILREEASGQWVAEHEWVLHEDIPIQGKAGTGVNAASGSDVNAKWLALGDNPPADPVVRVPQFDSFQTTNISDSVCSSKAYHRLVVRPDPSQDPGPEVYPLLLSQRSYKYGDVSVEGDGLGWQTLPGLS